MKSIKGYSTKDKEEIRVDKVKYPMSVEEIVRGKFLNDTHIQEIIIRLNRLSTEILRFNTFGGSRDKTAQAMVLALFELEVLQKGLGIEDHVKYKLGREWEDAKWDTDIKKYIDIYLKEKEEM